jgi:hypothetical protein
MDTSQQWGQGVQDCMYYGVQAGTMWGSKGQGKYKQQGCWWEAQGQGDRNKGQTEAEAAGWGKVGQWHAGEAGGQGDRQRCQAGTGWGNKGTRGQEGWGNTGAAGRGPGDSQGQWRAGSGNWGGRRAGGQAWSVPGGQEEMKASGTVWGRLRGQGISSQ